MPNVNTQELTSFKSTYNRDRTAARADLRSFINLSNSSQFCSFKPVHNVFATPLSRCPYHSLVIYTFVEQVSTFYSLTHTWMLFSSLLSGKLHCCCKSMSQGHSESGAVASGATCSITETDRVFYTIQNVSIKQKFRLCWCAAEHQTTEQDNWYLISNNSWCQDYFRNLFKHLRHRDKRRPRHHSPTTLTMNLRNKTKVKQYLPTAILPVIFFICTVAST